MPLTDNTRSVCRGGCVVYVCLRISSYTQYNTYPARSQMKQIDKMKQTLHKLVTAEIIIVAIYYAFLNDLLVSCIYTLYVLQSVVLTNSTKQGQKTMALYHTVPIRHGRPWGSSMEISILYRA